MSLLVSRAQGRGIKRRMSAPEYSSRAKRLRHDSVEGVQSAASSATAFDSRVIMCPESDSAAKPVAKSAGCPAMATVERDDPDPLPFASLPFHGQRSKPNLSVNIPSPRSFIIRSDTKITDGVGPSTHPRTPYLPSTPPDRLVQHPSNPPPVPRHIRAKHLSPGDETPTETEIMIEAAHARRVERLWAPTPIEWSFSSTLNHLPTPTQSSMTSPFNSRCNSPCETRYVDVKSNAPEDASNSMRSMVSHAHLGTDVDTAPVLSSYIMPRPPPRRSSLPRPSTPLPYSPASGPAPRLPPIRRRSTLGGSLVISPQSLL
ncbi:hypothetical protein BS47DRAFT_1357883 [Hydnum rufescens UP504]|uniref:Uncharacterized protein n=1 Tax=Hydnum rufescens UP504 TaxID=1448309 RepID=A0A9P6DZT8_9AGAM|nr:hypothetical protein BS47DRAFT_1357883 [Hydnum rufescens UP504]